MHIYQIITLCILNENNDICPLYFKTAERRGEKLCIGEKDWKETCKILRVVSSGHGNGGHFFTINGLGALLYFSSVSC